MKISSKAIYEKSDCRAIPFFFFRAQRKKQRFNFASFYISIDRIGKDQAQGFSVFAVD